MASIRVRERKDGSSYTAVLYALDADTHVALRHFYDAVLGAIGGRRIMETGDAIGYGTAAPEFWIGRQTTGEGFRESHIAFTAQDRTSVRDFFEAALSAGAEVIHEPRLWPEYHPNYFGVFVRDPDGNNVEAVCHTAADT